MSHEESLVKASLEESLQYPFITTEYAGSDNLQKLESMGWRYIDVSGDGNCRYYCLILGLENNGNFQFSPKKPYNKASNMQHHLPWQGKIYSLHKTLQKCSKELLEKHFHSGKEPKWWWMLNVHNRESR